MFLLPAHFPQAWVPHNARHAGLAVPWADGQNGGPSPEWLRSMWVLAIDIAQQQLGPGQAPADPWEALDLWPLLPVHSGQQLLRVRHRRMLLPPPLPQVREPVSDHI